VGTLMMESRVRNPGWKACLRLSEYNDGPLCLATEYWTAEVIG